MLHLNSKYLQNIFYGEPRIYNMDKNGLEKLDNNFQVKVKKLVE